MHDSAALLLRDGEILSAIEEARLNRVKHTQLLSDQRHQVLS